MAALWSMQSTNTTKLHRQRQSLIHSHNTSTRRGSPGCVFSMISWTTILLLLLGDHVTSAMDGNGVPGTTQTISGYDTEMGEDAMCWVSRASPTPDTGIPFPNGVLVEDFALADQVELLRECPGKTWLLARAPTEFYTIKDFRPRTGVWYNYTINGIIDMAAIMGERIMSDGNTSRIAMSIVACDTVRAGFCSPFVHDQANAREAAEKIQAEAEAESGTVAADGDAEPPEVVVPKKKVYGNRHGGSHVHAPAVVLDIPDPDDPNLIFSFEQQIPMRINDPGSFFVIATLQFFTGGGDEDGGIVGRPRYRYDAAVALRADERLVTYQAPAVILTVSDTVSTIAYVGIGLSSLGLLALLWQTVKNYKHQVLQLSQAPFLVLYLVCALIATMSSLLLEPESDFYCFISHPLVLIPLQCFYSISLARLWRINAVVSPLLRDRFKLSRRQQASAHDIMGLSSFFERLWERVSSFFTPQQGFRKTVSPNKASWIVFFGTLPQVVMQAIILVVQPRHKMVEYNEDQSTGRCLCDDRHRNRSNDLVPYSMAILFVLVLVLLVMAYASRQLPSLLNESSVIYETTLVSVFLVILTLGVIEVTDAPTTSPDVQFILSTMLIWSITLNSTLRIIFPKLRMIWQGQTILVSQLVKDEKQKLQKYTSSSGSHSRVSGISSSGLEVSVPFTDSQNVPSECHDDNLYDAGISKSSPNVDYPLKPIPIKGESSTLVHESGIVHGDEGGDLSSDNKETDIERGDRPELERKFSSSRDLWVVKYEEKANGEQGEGQATTSITDGNNPSSPQKEESLRAVTFAASGDSNEDSGRKERNQERPRDGMLKKGQSYRKIVVRQSEAPSKRLIIKMIQLQDELDHVTGRITSGLNVEPDDWESVRKCTNKLEDLFSMVEFEWDDKK